MKATRQRINFCLIPLCLIVTVGAKSAKTHRNSKTGTLYLTRFVLRLKLKLPRPAKSYRI